MKRDNYKFKADGSPEFAANHLPPLKPCPRCGSKLEYWDEYFIVCSNCEFDVVLPKLSDALEPLQRPKMKSYREEVLRTCPGFKSDSLREKLNLGVLGLAGESGEVVDVVKKHLFHGQELNREKLIKEMGDVRWYLEYMCAALGITIEDVETTNVEKLRARYPEGFSFGAANAPRKPE